MNDSVVLDAMYGADAPTDPVVASAWAAADRAAGDATGLYADMQQFDAVTSHPWPFLLRAYDKGCGVELTAAQVRELVAEFYAVVEKNNDLLRKG